MACETGCEAEKKAITKSLDVLLDFRQKMIDRLKKEQPNEARDLMNPREIAGMNLVITYFDFPTWLYRFDDKLTRGMTVNINSYRFQRNRHLNDVSTILANLRGKATGTALRNAISMAGNQLRIYPYFSFAIYPVLPWRPLGLNATAGSSLGKQAGGGDSYIMFSPHMWGQHGKPGSSGYDGPGSEADEVLFHELVHGVRQLEGVSASDNVLKNDYGNEEEFIAVALSNIYLAEKNKKALRSGHGGFTSMQQPHDFLKSAQNKRLLLNFKKKQPTFFDELAAIPERKAWWNPLRELNDA